MKDVDAQSLFDNMVATLNPEVLEQHPEAANWHERLMILGGTAMGIILVLGVIAWLFHIKKGDWRIYAGIVRVVIGLLLGLLVYARVSLDAQYFILGVLVGIGADGLAGMLSGGGGAIVVRSLTNWVVSASCGPATGGCPGRRWAGTDNRHMGHYPHVLPGRHGRVVGPIDDIGCSLQAMALTKANLRFRVLEHLGVLAAG